ncbi:MAG: diguanylate cyclase [Cyanobium sp.]
MIRRLWTRLAGRNGPLHGRVYQSLWLEMLLAATGASAAMALVAGMVALNQGARTLARDTEQAQRQLSASLVSYEPRYNLQRKIQEASSGRLVMAALVLDQRGVVLAASNNALVGLPISAVLQQPTQAALRRLFADCPTPSTLLACLSRDATVFVGPLPWIGGDAVVAMHPYPLVLAESASYGERATLITLCDGRAASREALEISLTVFLAGLVPLIGACGGMMLRLRQRLIPDLLRLAQVDALSGVLNRRAFLETAEELLGRAQQAQLPMALALIDVDHFKMINDTFGHDAGDQVIRRVSELLRDSVRTDDVVGRLGGDEFVILVRLAGSPATAMLRRTLAQVSGTDMGISESETVQMTLSVGVATSDGPGAYNLSELMSAADAALYVAKDRGRNQVVNLEIITTDGGQGERPQTRTGNWQVRGI